MGILKENHTNILFLFANSFSKFSADREGPEEQIN